MLPVYAPSTHAPGTHAPSTHASGIHAPSMNGRISIYQARSQDFLKGGYVDV